MVRSRTLLALAVGGIVVLALAPGGFSARESGRAPLSSQEAGLLRSINEARASRGAPPLRIGPALLRAARAHSHAMLRTGSLDHGNWVGRLRRHGVRGRSFGETIAWGVGIHGTPQAIVRMWLASPPHRETLLRRGFRYVGVGVAVGSFEGFPGASVATADFAG